jgi:valyl-tRNA synthetase
MHPMIPFITEILWWKLNEVCPDRGVSGWLDCPAAQASPRLVRAPFPNAGQTDSAAETDLARLQEIIGAIRNLRNDHKVDPRKKVQVSLSTPKELASAIETNRELIELLAICELVAVQPELPAPAGSVRAGAAGCEIYIQGAVDEQAEADRQAKRRAELEKAIGAMEGRLANKGYTDKAPPHLVQQTRDQLAEAKAELQKLGM